MAHHCIKYRINADGTTPSFLCTHPDGLGGAFFVPDPSTPSPRDSVMIGISETDEVGDSEILATKDDLINYLRSISSDWSLPDPNDRFNPELRVPFDPVAAAEFVWNKLDALNSAQ